ncbi:MAG: flagellar basal-body rod protein FlgF [Hydrogenobaculum sp.]
MALDYQPMYVLASGMSLEQRRLDVVANNIANADTPGFKKDFLSALAYYTPDATKEPGNAPDNPSNNYVYPIMEKIYTNYTEGPIKKTDNPLDLAINGKGFFKVMNDKGEIFYQRRGDFQLDKNGYLVNHYGMKVLGPNNQPIQIPPIATSIHISPQGNVFITTQGTNETPSQVGTIGLVDLTNPQKAGNDLYTAQNATPDTTSTLIQGALEGSNVNPVREMVQLIDLSKAYQIYGNLVKGLETIQSKVSNNFG